jgi:hypothetical protein
MESVEEEVAAPPVPPVKKPRPSNKTTWLLTYGVGGPSISNDLLKTHTKLVVDECYTTTDKANRYTLIHLVKKVRQTVIQKAMDTLATETGITLTGVYGYDLITSNSAEEPHAVQGNALYKWMVKSFKTRSSAFESWISEGKLGRGLFSGYMESPREKSLANLMTWTKRKLARTVFTLRESEGKLEAKLSNLEKDKRQLIDDLLSVRAELSRSEEGV